MTEVLFRAPIAEVFRYLADPRNRPQWQRSLRRVEMIDEGTPRVGMRWRDHTRVGLRFSLEITRLTPYRVWAERGTWHGVSAELTLRFVQVRSGARVQPHLSFSTGRFAVPAKILGWIAPQEVVADLRRAAGAVQGSDARH